MQGDLRGEDMPKVYTSSADKQAAKIIRVLKGAADGKHEQLADIWNISRQAVDYRIKHGNITLIDLYKAQHVFDLDAQDIEYLIRGKGQK